MNNQVLGILRLATARFLTESCRIEVEQNSTGEWGQPEPRWVMVANEVACRVIETKPLTIPTAGQVGGQEQIVDTYRIIAPYGTPFATNQRVTVGGVVYQVVGLVTDRTDETDVQCIAVRAR